MWREVTKKDSVSLVAAHKKEAEEAPSKIEPAEPVRKPPATTTVKAEPSRPRLNDQRNGDAPADNFPDPMADEAFRGIAGQVCSILEEQNETCREAILAQVLVGFGNLIGKGPYTKEGNFLNEFCLVVGPTATARKGTSLRYALDHLQYIDADWTQAVRACPPSGEGIIWHLRDARMVKNKVDPVLPKNGRFFGLKSSAASWPASLKVGHCLSVCASAGTTIKNWKI